MRLILASESPRRQQILKEAGFDYKVIPSKYNECLFSNQPILTAKTFALNKAKDVFENLPFNQDCVVLGADTVVYHNGQILGKPKDKEHACQMLLSLSGKVHTVITGFCVYSKEQIIVDHDESLVCFNQLDSKVIDAYLESGLYIGKAGAYGIQDKQFNLVKNFTGSINNVIGLPIEKIKPILLKALKI